jgi:hypothetical protein
MKFSVANFVAYTTPLEGSVNHMYLDDKGLVTDDLGDLIDSPKAAMATPWHVGAPDGPLASEDQIVDEWNRTKHSGMAGRGGGNQRPGKTLFLDQVTMTSVFTARLNENEKLLAGLFVGWDDFTQEAQLVCHSMTWAMGEDKVRSAFVHFCAALNQTPPNYLEAGNQSRMAGDSVDNSLRRRNNANLTLLVNPPVMGNLPEDVLNRQLTELTAGTWTPMNRWQPDGTWK